MAGQVYQLLVGLGSQAKNFGKTKGRMRISCPTRSNTNYRPTWIILILMLMDLLILKTYGQLLSSGCDHTLWDSTGEQGVWHVQAVCQDGLIDWKHPYGAVRVTFNLHGSGSTSVTTCFKANSSYTEAVITLEEEGDSLRKLVILNSSQPSMGRELCLAGGSSVSPLTLYIETVADTDSTAIGQVQIAYDLSLNDVVGNNNEDCRPCTDEELLQAVCSSDFVLSGKIEDVQHNAETNETEIKILSNEVVRQKRSTFKRQELLQEASPPNDNSILKYGSIGDVKPPTIYTGNIIVPHKCGVRYGEGEFLFMGRIKLDRAHLSCAPRLEEFEELWFRADREGRSFCSPS